MPVKIQMRPSGLFVLCASFQAAHLINPDKKSRQRKILLPALSRFIQALADAAGFFSLRFCHMVHRGPAIQMVE